MTDENTLVGVSVRSEHFMHGSGGLSLRPVENFLYSDLWGLIAGLTQSNENFRIDETFILHVTYVSLPVGLGARRQKNLTIDAVTQRSIVSINNNDNLCLPRALVVGEVYLKLKASDSQNVRDEWRAIRDSRRMLQRERAESLTRDAGVICPSVGCGFLEIQKFQNHYKPRGIAIVAYDKTTLGSGEEPFFDGRAQIARTLQGVINLIHDHVNQHFDVVLNLIGAARTKFFCSYCNKRFNFIDQHRCEKICSSCFVSPSCSSANGELIKCNECHRNFLGQTCYNNHKARGSYKKNNKILCEILKMCEKCDRLVNIYRGKHVCGVRWCSNCKKDHTANELCFMQPLRERKNESAKKKFLYIFYDFETRQDTAYRNSASVKLHIVNLCVAQQVCTDCLDNNDISQWCNTCGVREHVFRDAPVKQLTDLCIREHTEFKEIVCIAHNARSFDAQFILKELAERSTQVLPTVILNGQNIITMQYGKTRFIDSLNYFQMKLSALPATFDLPPSAKKGYFPHLFNTEANSNYVGPLPHSSFYAPDSMSSTERDAFFRWYEAERARDSIFDLKNDIVEYCRTDVEILRRACMAFRKIFLAVGDTDPFVSATTIASACSQVFRKKFLKPDTIGIIPPTGYRRADRHSQKSIEWLLQCEREIGREIIHAGREREFRLPEGFLVDGYLQPVQSSAAGDDKGIVFEYQGCYTHGCPACFKNNRDKATAYGRTFAEVYETTRAKIARMKSFGYEVREVWECEFDRRKIENPEIASYLANHPLITKITLNPRDAFYGGRTENIVAYYKVKDGEIIKYTDICSLYPYVCKRGRFPVGHPRIYVGSECAALTNGENNDLSRVEGLVKCKILPPRDLFLPLLPIKMHGRLLFALCRSCCEGMLQNDCQHEDIHDREFTGTWVADELRKAVEIGYRVTEIYIVWQYEITQLDSRTSRGGLFADYVNTFLQLKQQASGWPTWCVDEDAKERYVREYELAEGITLIPEKIEKNSGLRAVAKLCLNSFWGKFGQRNNLKQTAVIKKREELLKLLTDPTIEVFNLLMVNDDLMYANWQFIEDAAAPASHTNVAIAAYTTAQARLKLYTYLEKLGRRVLYYDTDSCIFVCNNKNVGEYNPPVGTLLGDMTDELSVYGNNVYIDTFVSGGPKFYGYRVVSPSADASGTRVHEHCKVKGISLNYGNSLKINFETIKELIEKYFDDDDESNAEECDAGIKLHFRAIRRMPTHDVVTRDEFKSCSVVLKKRRYIAPELSLPFGFKE